VRLHDSDATGSDLDTEGLSPDVDHQEQAHPQLHLLYAAATDKHTAELAGVQRASDPHPVLVYTVLVLPVVSSCLVEDRQA
jgi:hypothetical protein